MPHAERSTTRLGATLLIVGAAPFAAGAALGGADAPRVCPFSLVTGAPCPLCGGTRAFALAAHGDSGFLEYNAVWVAVAAAVAVAGIALLVLAATGRRRLPSLPRPLVVGAGVLVVAAAWAWALVQRDVIVA
jgi:hypothetical protein